MSLHDDIMRLPCTPPADANINQALSYKSGHRDALHAAAELAEGADEGRRELLEALINLDRVVSMSVEGSAARRKAHEATHAAIAKARGN